MSHPSIPAPSQAAHEMRNALLALNLNLDLLSRQAQGHPAVERALPRLRSAMERLEALARSLDPARKPAA